MYEETGQPCNCNEALASGDVARTCKRCYARKAPHKSGGVYYVNPKGVHTECKSCKAPHLMHNGRCVARESCPASKAQYLVGSLGGRCEAPFACARGKRVGGDNPGGRCKCASRDVCRDCVWNAGSAEQQCTLCKKHMVLLNGRCVSAAECIGKGLVPVRAASGARGGRCLASAPPSVAGTEE